jgi:hypothetical protein
MPVLAAIGVGLVELERRARGALDLVDAVDRSQTMRIGPRRSVVREEVT